VFFFFITVCVDKCRSNRFRKPDKEIPKIEQPQLTVNEDVREHETQINDKSDVDWHLKVNNLHKTYKGKGLHAVCGNTFGVEKGTVMGLLGPNGAGKSTTFGMLSMELPRSNG